jgi:hypothetical protein
MAQFDTIPPSVPTNLRVTDIKADGFGVAWSPSVDMESDTIFYSVYVDDMYMSETVDTFFNVTHLDTNTLYTVAVDARDVSYNVSEKCQPITVTTLRDTVAPGVPGNFILDETHACIAKLSWNAAQDDNGIKRYVLTNTADSSTEETADTCITLRKLEPLATYSYALHAVDVAERASGTTEPVTFQTTASKGEIWFITNGVLTMQGDEATYDRIASWDFNVLLPYFLDTNEVTSEIKLMFLSSSLSRSDVTAAYTTVNVPILLAEGYVQGKMGMTDSVMDVHFGGIYSGVLPSGTDINILDTEHPLSAGLSGTVTIADSTGMNASWRMKWGYPAPSADCIAELTDSSGKMFYYAYETGDTMFYTVAPARRVMFGIGDNVATKFTDEGWQLFDAALFWTMSMDVPVTEDTTSDTTDTTTVDTAATAQTDNDACGSCGSGAGLALLPLISTRLWVLFRKRKRRKR